MSTRPADGREDAAERPDARELAEYAAEQRRTRRAAHRAPLGPSDDPWPANSPYRMR